MRRRNTREERKNRETIKRWGRRKEGCGMRKKGKMDGNRKEKMGTKKEGKGKRRGRGDGGGE